MNTVCFANSVIDAYPIGVYIITYEDIPYGGMSMEVVTWLRRNARIAGQRTGQKQKLKI